MELNNPTTGASLPAREPATLEVADALAEQLRQAGLRLAACSVQERAAMLREVGKILEAKSDECARLMAHEMGKPLREGKAEVEKCAWVCQYYAENGPRLLAPQPIETQATRSYVAFEPLGVVLAIMPWNFPYWQVFRFAAPALMAGNTVLLKHASNVQGCAESIERLLTEVQARPVVLRNVHLTNQDTQVLIAHDAIAAVTLTGSTRAGRAVAAAAGAALKKCVLELGGSDPYLVLSDADVESAAATCVAGRVVNNGQSCIAAKRLIVVRQHREAFERAVVKRMRDKRSGDPLEPDTELGPMARFDLRQTLHEQVSASVRRGARCLLGGELPEGPGAYYPPTVLSGVAPGMPAYEEELFGPVACILEAADDDDAVRIANDSAFGLGAAVFSRDSARAERIASRLQAGCCFVNEFVRSDPRLPFGGVKQSGYGRELASFGIREFLNIKTIYVK